MDNGPYQPHRKPYPETHMTRFLTDPSRDKLAPYVSVMAGITFGIGVAACVGALFYMINSHL